ncbi:Hypothetical predicted protein, partial [Pelobates cultripes]
MRFQHFLTLLSGLVECMFFAGVTFGWASLVFVLKNEKYFQDLCPSPGNQSINATDSCSQQDEQFSLIFTVAGLVNNFVTLPCGYIFDHFGTAVTRFLSISIYTAATILIALSNEGAVPKWCFTATLFLMPNTFFPYPLPEGYSYGLKCKKNKASKPTTISNGEEDLGIKTEEGQLSINSTLLLETKAVSFISCVRSSLFWFHFIWLSVMQLRHYMFIATLNPTLTRLSGGDPLTVSHYTNVFAVSQFCGILCAPWNGIIIDRFKGKYK